MGFLGEWERTLPGSGAEKQDSEIHHISEAEARAPEPTTTKTTQTVHSHTTEGASSVCSQLFPRKQGL